jgi:menaquinone-specific isochorismate synthase
MLDTRDDENLSSHNKNDISVLKPELTGSVECAINLARTSGKSSLFSITIPFENTDPLAVLELAGDKNGFQFYWEHPDEAIAIAAGNSVLRIKARGMDRYRNISRHISSWKDQTVEYCEFDHTLNGVFYLGGFSFFDQKARTDWQFFDSASFVVPEWIFVRDGQLCLLTIIRKLDATENAEEVCNNLLKHIEELRKCIQSGIKGDFFPVYDQDELQFDPVETRYDYLRWKEEITLATRMIAEKTFGKIVVARSLDIQASREITSTRVVNQLRKEYPSCYSFLIQMNGSATFLGSSPERLFSYRPSVILTEALAGSISRGKTATEDAILEKKLLQSRKDLEEHQFVVNAISEKIRNYAKYLEIPNQPGIKKFPNVQHLYTPISVWFNKEINPFELIELLHPTPAVGGYPGADSMRYIQQLEHFERGWYAGPMGWYNNRNRGEFLVGIRSGLIRKDKASFFAGCGIVADSNAETEWDETKLKLIPMLSALRHG